MTTISELRTIVDIWALGAKAEAFDELVKLPLADKVVDWAKEDPLSIQDGMADLAEYQLNHDIRGVLVKSPYGRFWLVADKGKPDQYPTFTPEELFEFFFDFVELIIREGKPPF